MAVEALRCSGMRVNSSLPGGTAPSPSTNDYASAARTAFAVAATGVGISPLTACGSFNP